MRVFAKIAALAGETADVRPGDVEILWEHAGRAYAVPTTEGLEAIRTLARTEGIFLDPVYTGKAMAGLSSLVLQEGNVSGRLAFVHTGGTPGLFAYQGTLSR